MPPMLTISNLPLSNNRTSSGFSNRFKMTSSMAHLRLQWFSLRAVYQPSPDSSKLDRISIAFTAGGRNLECGDWSPLCVTSEARAATCRRTPIESCFAPMVEPHQGEGRRHVQNSHCPTEILPAP